MFEKVKNILVDSLNVDENLISLEANLENDLGIDSLAAVELSLELEQAFACEFTDEELQNLVTVNDICQLVQAKQG